jgi:K+-sensing histidine kinase KdpD
VANCNEKCGLKQKDSQRESQERILNEHILNLLKIMSHDVRGSLVSISATLKLLNSGYYGKTEEEVANCLGELLSKTLGLIRITEEYLDKAFSIADELEARGEALNLKHDIISPVLEELSLELKEHSIFIDHRFEAIPNERIFIKVNRIWLKTVFRNLLKNAIKYGEKGCRIALGFEDQGSLYRLNVYNSGNPIPEETRGKLFSKAIRVGIRRNRDRVTEGMGLGLYLIKKIVQKQGGDLWYEVTEDGSNFVFTLPRG